MPPTKRKLPKKAQEIAGKIDCKARSVDSTNFVSGHEAGA